jgi:hypothetical protein
LRVQEDLDEASQVLVEIHPREIARLIELFVHQGDRLNAALAFSEQLPRSFVVDVKRLQAE